MISFVQSNLEWIVFTLCLLVGLIANSWGYGKNRSGSGGSGCGGYEGGGGDGGGGDSWSDGGGGDGGGD
jgi:hypothetical protein